MGDPLSLAAGIIGLISLTIQVLQVAVKFKDDAETVDEDVKSLVQELTVLKQILELLRAAWEDKRLPPDFDLSALAGIELACERQLRNLLERLTRASGWLQRKPYVSLRGALFRLKWPFEAEKTREITNTIHRYYSIFSWALHHRESELLLKVSDDVCRILRDQDRILDEFRTIFQSFTDVRQHIDAATEVTNNVLRVVQQDTAALDEICAGVKEIKTDTTTLVALNHFSERLEILKKEASASAEDESRIRRKIIENYSNKQREQFIERIPSVTYLERQRQAFGNHQPGTGLWFLSDPQFQAWKEGEDPSILLCKGIPGAGKSVLTSLAIDNVSKNCSESDIQVAYLYCDYRNQASETVSILLSSILRQLLTPSRLIFPFVRDKCLELCTKYSTPNALVTEHVQLIRILSRMSHRTYIFVDAIDEVMESGPRGEDIRNEFLGKLFGLSDLCRLLVTCRPHIDIDSFSAPSHCRTIEIRAKDEDISAYVASTITASKTLREYVGRDPDLEPEIIRAVQLKANGVFLLARFHMSRIAAAVCPRDVREMLKSLSNNLPDVYGFCLERLRCQHPNKWHLARRALSWVSKARRSLKDHELVQALSFNHGDPDVDPSGMIDVSLIIEVCDGMLRLEPPAHGDDTARPVVSFTHSTIAEFMDHIFACSDAHLDMANTSIGYLTMDKLSIEDSPAARQARYPFSEYAMMYWGEHAANSQKTIDTSLLLTLAKKSSSPLVEVSRLGLEYALQSLLDSGFSPNDSYRGSSPLAISAAYGRSRCVSILLKAGANVNYASDSLGPLNTALTCAVHYGHLQIVHLLIDAGADLDIGRIPPIIAAVKAGHLHIMEQLLCAGCNPNVKCGGKSPIHTALELNKLDVAEALIHGGADLNSRSLSFQITPLEQAIYQRQWDIAEKLISNGADANIQARVSLNPLQRAAYEGKRKLVQTMIQAGGADGPSTATHSNGLDSDFLSRGTTEVMKVPNGTSTFAVTKDKSAHASKSPLHLALEGRHHHIAKLLIQEGVGISQVCGNPPYTPLEWAAGQNNSALVVQLLSAGANPNLGGQGIPLLSAVSRFVKAENIHGPQSTAVIALLLDAGADPCVRDGTFVGILRTWIHDNIQFRWWSKSDPNVRRLRVALAMSDDWVII